MVEFFATVLHWGYLFFVSLCVALGLALLIIGVFRAFDLAITRILNAGAIVEAALEARRQGRAPLLRALHWWGRRGKDQ